MVLWPTSSLFAASWTVIGQIPLDLVVDRPRPPRAIRHVATIPAIDDSRWITERGLRLVCRLAIYTRSVVFDRSGCCMERRDSTYWAAYVLGCQDEVLRYRAGQFESRAVLGDVPGFFETLSKFESGVAEFYRAIGLLMSRGKLKRRSAVALSMAVFRIHKDTKSFVINQFAELFGRERIRFEYRWYPSGDENPAWWRIEELSSSLLDEDDEEHQWHELGRMVTRLFREDRHAIIDSNSQDIYLCLNNILRIVEKLFPTSEAAILSSSIEDVRTSFGALMEPFARAAYRSCHLPVTRLDGSVRRLLRGISLPETVLFLDPDRPTIFGRPIPLDQPRLIKCLWALAERPMTTLSRKEFIGVLNSDRDWRYLSADFSRLRRKLRPLIDDH